MGPKVPGLFLEGDFSSIFGIVLSRTCSSTPPGEAMSKRATAATIVLLTALVGGGLTSPANAARPGITISSTAQASAGSTITVRGNLTRGASGLKVRLQTRSGARWATLKQKKQGNRRAFAFTVKVRAGSNAFRVVTTKTKRLSAATSRVVRVTGLARPAAANPPKVTTELDRIRATLVADTNSYRTKRGLRPLALHAGLSGVAQRWSDTMAARKSMVHNLKLSSLVPGAWRRIGENIGMGYDLNAITAAWFASPGHKANILGEFTHIGIGYTVDREGTPWYVQDFAKY